PLTRDRGGGNPGQGQLPDALTGDELVSRHASALAQRIDAAVVDDRVRVDVGQRADLRGNRGTGQRVGPQVAAVLVTIGHQLAGRIAGDDGALPRRRSRHAEHARLAARRDFLPDQRTVFGAERVDLVVLRHYVDGVERDRGRTAQRTGGLDPPYLGTGLRVERDHVAGAVRRIDPAIGEADAAAEGRIAEVAFHLDPVLPAPSSEERRGGNEG